MVQELYRSIRAAVRVEYERNEQRWSSWKPEKAHRQLALSDATTALRPVTEWSGWAGVV